MLYNKDNTVIDTKKRRSHPGWFDDIVVMAGNWEPLAHRRRAVLGCVNDEDRYDREHSEEMVARLGEAQVTAVVWHFFKGLGYSYEKEDMGKSRLFGQLCHKQGIKFGTYINFGSVYAETFFEETPEARDWIALDTQGQGQFYSEYFRCYYRHRPCLNHQPYIDYVERMTLLAIEQGGSDWIHFDNNAQMPCYCDKCRCGFRKFLREKYAGDATVRFGHNQIDHIELPRGTARMGIDTLSSLHEPVLQEWVAYRCKLLADAVGQVSQAVERSAPDVIVGANPPFDCGEFGPLVWGADTEALAEHTDLLFNEDANYPRVAENGGLIGHLFTFKTGRSLGIRVAVHQPGATTYPVSPEHARLSLLEAAIFNQGHLGHVYHASDLLDGLDDNDARPSTVRFIRQHADSFTQTETLAEVAFLRSNHSLTNNWRDSWQSYILFGQVLAQFGFQFDVVTESQLGQLGNYRTLILANTISLADEHLEQIGDFVRGGGTVVATEDAASCDAWGRSRSPAGRRRLFGDLDKAVSVTGDHCDRQEALCEILGIKGTARERIFYVGHIQRTQKFVHDFSRVWIPVIDHRYWELPGNAAEIASLILTAMGGQQTVGIKTPSLVVPQFVRRRKGNDLLLHLLNYHVEQPVDHLAVSLSFDGIEKTSGIKTLNMDKDVMEDVPFTLDNSVAQLAVPGFSVYRAVFIERRIHHLVSCI